MTPTPELSQTVSETHDVPMPARSPRLARALLVGVVALGAGGLALPDAPQRIDTVAVTPAASYVAIEVAPSPIALAAPSVTRPAPVKRATRTRAKVAKKKAVSSPKWVRPCYASVGSFYGMRWGRMHKGLDFNADTGDNIRAVGAGTVIGSGYLSEESGYGKITLIRHSNGYVSAYAHQSVSFVSSGDRVEAGEVIGEVGSTGHSTGSHLHFEIRTSTHGGQVNPLTWLREHGVSI